MKKLIVVISIIICQFSNAQESALIEAAESACSCLYEASKEYKDKIDCRNKFNSCLKQYIEEAQRIDSTINTPEELNNLIQKTLRDNCEKFNYIDSIVQDYTTNKETDFVVKIEDCQILKNGIFITEGDKDSAKIIMQDSLQTIKFKSGAYTKSKVVWLGPCSYKIIRIESTDPYEKQMVQPGEERVIRILGVENKKTITFELAARGRVYPGRLIKL